MIIRLSFPYFIKPDTIVIKNLPLIERKLDSVIENNSYSKNKYYTENVPTNVFVFNPNTVSFEELLSLGFTKKTAGVFIKYRSKGFVFKKKQDLKKVYGITDNFYNKLEPYILIENNISKKPESNFAEQKVEKITKYKPSAANKIIELNSADSLALLEINGIGPAFAKRILKYRSLLGGYINALQLKEVFGFTEEMFDKVKSQILVNAASVKKINLSKDDFKTINKHPYITYELTKNIFDWKRKTNITKENVAGIINDEELLKKLMPYLEF